MPVGYFSQQINYGTKINNGDSNSNIKRLSLKKLEEDYSKTLEQVYSPNQNSLHSDPLKPQQHVPKCQSGANSPHMKHSKQVPTSNVQNSYPSSSAYRSVSQQRSHAGKPNDRVPSRQASRSKKRNLNTSMGNHFSNSSSAVGAPLSATNN